MRRDETIRKCSSCGKTLEPDEAFCTKCGASFEESGETSDGGSAIGAQLQALANDFLSVHKLSPHWFELASRSGAQVPGQKVTIKYQAVAQLDPHQYQILFWESMMETLLGTAADASHTSTAPKAIDVNQDMHGYRMFGGPYGFHYDRLHRVVRAIANEQGWQFKLLMAKPVMDFKPAPEPQLPTQEPQGKTLPEPMPASGAPAEGHAEAVYPDTARKRRLIPLILAVTAAIVIAVVLIGVFSRGGRVTTIPDKPKPVVASQKATTSPKTARLTQKPSVPVIPPAVDYNAEGKQMAKAGKMEEAAALFEKAVQADPDNFNAWNNLGLALRKIGRPEDAVRAYQHAITVKPDFALVYKNLGIVYEQMDRKKDAADAYRKYAELNPSAADARSAREKAARLSVAGPGKGVKK